MDTIDRSNPTPVIVQNSVQRGKSAGTSFVGNYYNVMVATVPIGASASGSVQTWVNPETGTILATVMYMFSVSGTNTMDIRVSDDGTGAASGLFAGASQSLGCHYPASDYSATGTVGGIDLEWVVLGPGGTGTSNSITVTNNGAATGIGAGVLVIQYHPVGL